MPRVPIPIVGQAYEHRELELSAQVTKNLWPEYSPDARSVVSLHHMPGLKPFAALEGADRGAHVFNDVYFCVNGSNLYSIDADGNDTVHGVVKGTDRVIMADNGTQLVITTGDTAYIYTAAEGLQAITDPDLTKPTCVAWINGKFVFDNNAGTPGEFVVSEPSVVFDVSALDFAFAEGSPDDITRIITFQEKVYFFGSRSVEPWYDSGQGEPPLDPLIGYLRNYGVIGRNAITTTQEYIYFVDHKRIPRRTSGLDYQNIATAPIGIEWQSYGDMSDCIVNSFIHDSQRFITFNFPSVDRTWVFHEPSSSWIQWSYGVDDARHRCASIDQAYGVNIAADHTNGQIYQLDPNTYTDNGEIIQRERASHVIHGGLFESQGKKIFFDRVEFVVAVGDKTEYATVPVEPSTIQRGVCATVADLITSDDLLGEVPITLTTNSNFIIEDTDPAGNDTSFTDSPVFSFTCAFSISGAPDISAHLLDLYDADSAKHQLEIYLDSSGYLRLLGRNRSGSTVLDATVTNSGAGFADGTVHMVALVVNLEDAGGREVFIDGVDVTDTYVTWTTYTDDTLGLSDSGSVEYGFATNAETGLSFGRSGWVYATMAAAEASGDAWQDGDLVTIEADGGIEMVYFDDLAVGGLPGLIHRDPFNDGQTLINVELMNGQVNADPDLWTNFDYVGQYVPGGKGFWWDFDTNGGVGRINKVNSGYSGVRVYDDTVPDDTRTYLFAIINSLSIEGSIPHDHDITVELWADRNPGVGGMQLLRMEKRYTGTWQIGPTTTSLDWGTKRRFYMYLASLDGANGERAAVWLSDQGTAVEDWSPGSQASTTYLDFTVGADVDKTEALTVGDITLGVMTFGTPTSATASAGFLSFDDDCTLVPGAVWDEDGWVRDPGDFAGWYSMQPAAFFGPSFWKNTGSIDIALDSTSEYLASSLNDSESVPQTLNVNNGIGGTITANGFAADAQRPPAIAEEDTYLETDHWTSLYGFNSTRQPIPGLVRLSDWQIKSFETVFGASLESRTNFLGKFTVNCAVQISTRDADNKITFQNDPVSGGYGAIVLCDGGGNILDYVYQNGTASIVGASVTIPADGNTYYLICSSQTGEMRVNCRDTTVTTTAPPPVVIANVREIDWSSQFGGYDWPAPSGNWAYARQYEDECLAIKFNTSTIGSSIQGRMQFAAVSYTRGSVEISVSKTAGDFNVSKWAKDGPSYEEGQIDWQLAGSGLGERYIELEPNTEYFFNVRYAAVASSYSDYLKVQVISYILA